MAEAGQADFGPRMKRMREQRGVTLRQIADRTKLSVSALEALERNDISRLPGGIFSRSFVRSYAIEIGLDPEQTVREFLSQFPHDSVGLGSPHVGDDLDKRPSTRPRTLTIVMIVILAVIIAALVALFVSRQ